MLSLLLRLPCAAVAVTPIVAAAAFADEDGAFVPGLVDGLAGVKAIAASAGDSHSACLTADGAVYACGCFRDDDGQLAFSPEALQSNSMARVYPAASAKKPDPVRCPCRNADAGARRQADL